ncbi:Do family serine endopeptidase [Cohaesibacter celericrescens]|uniref:Do family serine endopeptidase n=1 Tax=Cohaesibacter celericrescens TaxID=2067669 RepID=UPI001FDF1B11|nr:Do family serine endopeptidase [Cohaesibacter celericrescens]
MLMLVLERLSHCAHGLRRFGLIGGTIALAVMAGLPCDVDAKDAEQGQAASGQMPHQTSMGPKSVADLAERLIPAVVNISTRSLVDSKDSIPLPKVPDGSPFQDFFEDFFEKNQEEGGRKRSVQSLGSGFVIDASGLIVTNNHVIAGADKIRVKFSDGGQYDAEIVGRDTKTDLALLKVDTPKPLSTVPFGLEKDVRVGDWVMAIGNPFGLGGSVSIGIVSARNRNINTGPYDSFIQTDAAINRGNSGGPLFDMYGNVVGVNTAIISPSGASIGLGFAIPADITSRVVTQLKEFGETRRGWLGIRIQQVSEDLAEGLGLSDARGVLIAWVNEAGPAEKAGLKPGDVIVRYGGEAVSEVRDLTRFVAETTIGAEVEVEFYRKGQLMALSVVAGHLEASESKVPIAKNADKLSRLFGMSLSELTPAERRKHNLGDSVEGVVVHEVEPHSLAGQKGIQTGMVIVEINQEIVSTPQSVVKRVETLKAEGKSTIVFLLARPDGGELVFVPIKLDDSAPEGGLPPKD